MPFSHDDELGNNLSFALVKVRTDEGIVGHGELCDGWCCRWPMVGKAVVESVLKLLLLEESPEQIEGILSKIRAWTRRSLTTAGC